MAQTAILYPSSSVGLPLRVDGDQTHHLGLGGSSDAWSSLYIARVAATWARTGGTPGYVANYFNTAQARKDVRLECYRPMIYEPVLNLQQLTTWENISSGSTRVGGRVSMQLFDVKGSFKCRIQLHPGNPEAAQQLPDGSSGWVTNGINKQGSLYTDVQFVRVVGIEVFDMGAGTPSTVTIAQSSTVPAFTDEGSPNGLGDDGFGVVNTPRYWLTAPTMTDIFEGYAHNAEATTLSTWQAYDTNYGELLPMRTNGFASGAGDLSEAVVHQCMKNERLISYKYRKGQAEVAGPAEAQSFLVGTQRRKFKIFHDKIIAFSPPAISNSGTIRKGGARIWEGRLAFKTGRVQSPKNGQSTIEGATSRVFYYFMPTVSNTVNGMQAYPLVTATSGTENGWGYTGDVTAGIFPGSGHHHFTVSVTDERSSIKNFNPLGLAV